MPALHFRFRPRYRGVAWVAIAIGAAVLVRAAIVGATGLVWASGAAGVALGILYLLSPTWRMTVAVDDDALEVARAGERRFRLPWADVVRVIASPSTHTCFVDGGAPDRSLLVPGDGAPAPYAIEGRDQLFAAIVARVPAGRLVEVDLLERHRDLDR